MNNFLFLFKKLQRYNFSRYLILLSILFILLYFIYQEKKRVSLGRTYPCDTRFFL